MTNFRKTPSLPTAFGTDPDGEFLVGHRNGVVARMTASTAL